MQAVKVGDTTFGPPVEAVSPSGLAFLNSTKEELALLKTVAPPGVNLTDAYHGTVNTTEVDSKALLSTVATTAAPLAIVSLTN